MADDLLTPVEFARTIKAKYPDYASVPDDELATRMLEKYPDYNARIRVSPLTAGNINLENRPRVKNPDGSISTVRSMSFEDNGKEILVPTVSDDGRLLSDDQAINLYRQTGKHLGIFSDPASATIYAQRLHNDQARQITQPASPAPSGPSVPTLGMAAELVGQTAIGAAKGLGNTVFGLGKAVHDYTPIGRISDAIQPGAFAQKPAELVPQGRAQQVGYGAEQIGEFFLPTGQAGAIGKVLNPANAARLLAAAEVAKAGVTTLAQTGSPTAAGVSSAIGAAIPGIGAARRAISGRLAGSAEKSMAQALGATKEAAKEEAARLAPQMLERGVGGSRATMLERAAAEVKDIGAQIGAEVEAAAQAGKTISSESFTGTLAKARATLTEPHPVTGEMLAIPGQETAIKQLDRLAEFTRTLGDDIPVDKAQRLKTAWDRIVSKAGLFGPKATASASDNAKAWAFREAAGSMRKLIAEGSPTLADLNQEFRFWKGLENVLTATEKRTQAQAGGLVSGITGAAGAATGFASGDSLGDKLEKAAVGGLVGRQVVRVLQSPAFRTQVAGPLKQKLADALASGEQGKILYALGRITSAVPAIVTQGK